MFDIIGVHHVAGHWAWHLLHAVGVLAFLSIPVLLAGEAPESDQVEPEKGAG